MSDTINTRVERVGTFLCFLSFPNAFVTKSFPFSFQSQKEWLSVFEKEVKSYMRSLPLQASPVKPQVKASIVEKVLEYMGTLGGGNVGVPFQIDKLRSICQCFQLNVLCEMCLTVRLFPCFAKFSKFYHEPLKCQYRCILYG